MPHWGTEYTARLNRSQRDLGRAAIEAGADVVLGDHTHWAGGLAIVDGRPIVSSMGDFVFNISRSEMTQEGLLVELTFSGARLVQLRLRPYLVVDGVQPNLLDPAGSGSVVMDQVFGASPDLPW